MKSLIFLSVFLALAVAQDEPQTIGATPPPGPTDGPAGRFQIATTEHAKERLTLRIDSVTGRTWQLVTIPFKMPGTDAPASITGWNEITEDVLGDIRILTTKKPVKPTR